VAAEESSYRMRPASIQDAAAVRSLSNATLSHPDGKGRKEGHRAAAQRGELLLLERYEGRLRDWRICAFVEWHIRVDDVLTIRDFGTDGESPHPGMVNLLVTELMRSLSPTAATIKVRADATDWNDIIRSIAGFVLDGTEYRRPHWFNVWQWTRESEAEAARASRAPRFRR
jgi:hypothetical protein